MVLNDKLNEVINEGILDSILPFICAAILPRQNSKQNINHVCGLKTKARNNADVSDIQPEAKSASNENIFVNKDRHLRRNLNQSINLLSK